MAASPFQVAAPALSGPNYGATSSQTPSTTGGNNTPLQINSNDQATNVTSPVSVNQGPNQTQNAAPAVYSASSAIKKINTQIVPAITAGNAGIAAQNQKNAIDPALQMTPQELANPALYTARMAALNASKTGTQTPTTPTVSPADQAMKDAANTPDPGFQFVYDANGAKQQVPQGQPIPDGLSANPPADPTKNGHAVVQSTTTADGTTYQQYSDGTYGIADQNGQFAGTATQADYQNAYNNSPETVIQHIQSQLSSLSAGAVPLSAPQQAQINALQNQLAQNITTQTQANTNFTGATTVAENLYGMGNSLSGIGAIKATIDAGVAAIQKLQSEAAGAVAKMTDDFQQENYKDLLDSYNAQLSATNAIQTHIENMQKFAETQKVDAATEQHQQFQDTISSENLTLSQKKQAFDQYVQQANLTETQKNDATDRWYKEQDIALRAAAANPYTPNGLGPVSTTATGAPSKSQQAAFLAQYPPNVQTQITGLSNYSLLPTSFPTRANKGQMDRATAVALAKQYDPTYDENLAASRQKVATTYSDGTSAPSKSITALNTAAAHLASLAQSFSTLHNVGFGPANTFVNTAGAITGLKSTAGTATNLAAVTGELAAAFKSSGATDAEIKSLGTIDVNSPPAAVYAYIKTATALMGGKLSELQDSYTAAMGAPPTASFLHPTAANNLLQLESSGYSVDVPQLNQSAPVELKNFVAANPTTNTPVYNQAVAAIKSVNGGQDPSADDIYNLLQQQGYTQ